MLRRFAHLLLSVTMLWFAHANLWTGAAGHELREVSGNLHSGEQRLAAHPHSAAAIESYENESRFTASVPSLGTSRWSLMGPALPAAIVAAPELHTATVAVRDIARTVVPVSSASLHARRARHLASMRATSTVRRLDALWRADAQRLLAIPQYAIAPPLIG